MASRNAAERGAFFTRREAAAVLRGDAARRSAGSIKSLVYSLTVRNKRATFTLVCQALKCKRLPQLYTCCALAYKVFDRMPRRISLAVSKGMRLAVSVLFVFG
jgi:hypothetical protein